MEAFAEYGLVGVMLGGIFVGVAWLARRLFPILERVADTHIDFVKHTKASQTETNTRICDHIDDEETTIESLKRAGCHACEVADEVADRLQLSQEARKHIAAIRSELEAK